MSRASSPALAVPAVSAGKAARAARAGILPGIVPATASRPARWRHFTRRRRRKLGGQGAEGNRISMILQTEEARDGVDPVQEMVEGQAALKAEPVPVA
jgi:hypothetical protein